MHGFNKVGEAKLSVLFWDIYHSSLYNKSGTYIADEFPQALQLNYLRAISADDLIKHTKEEWKKLGVSANHLDKWLPLLNDIFPDINKGDTLILIVSKSKTSEFFFNDQSIGVISDELFGENFLKIWLDENCSYPKVRNKLIGLSGD